MKKDVPLRKKNCACLISMRLESGPVLPIMKSRVVNQTKNAVQIRMKSRVVNRTKSVLTKKTSVVVENQKTVAKGTATNMAMITSTAKTTNIKN